MSVPWRRLICGNGDCLLEKGHRGTCEFQSDLRAEAEREFMAAVDETCRALRVIDSRSGVPLAACLERAAEKFRKSQ